MPLLILSYQGKSGQGITRVRVGPPPSREALRKEGRAALGDGTRSPHRPSQKLVPTHVLRCPSTSWVKRRL